MDAQNYKEQQLVGHWRYAGGRFCCDWMLLEDGTFGASVTDRGELVSNPRGRWAIEGDQLLSFCIRDELGMALFSEDRDVLLEVTDRYFVIRTRDGARRKYMKIS
jgi:hypothetical protein